MNFTSIRLRETIRHRSSKSPSGSTTCNLSSTRWRSIPDPQEPPPEPHFRVGSAKQSRQHRIEALPASGGRTKALGVEGEKAAFDERREIGAEEGFDVRAGGAF